MLSRIIQRFEGIALQVLMVMMAVVLTATIVDLAWLLWVDFSSPPYFLLSVDELLELFSQFLLVLIGLELLETVIKTYATPQQPHFEVVLNVAIIAVARKIIILDIRDSFEHHRVGGHHLGVGHCLLPDEKRAAGSLAG